MKGVYFVLIIILVNAVFTSAVKINEIEANPVGTDTDNEWIELYNELGIMVDISEWKFKDANENVNIIPNGSFMHPGGFFVFNTSAPLVINNNDEVITLLDDHDFVIDVSLSDIDDNDNDDKTWQREFDGFDTDSDADWIFRQGSQGFSNNADLIPPEILDQTRDLDPVFETDDLMLGCLINETNLVSAFIQGTWQGNWNNFTLTIPDQEEEIYSLNLTVEDNNLESGELVEWFCIAEDIAGNFGFGNLENFEVVTRTIVETFPDEPDGLDGWYITVPLFTLISEPRAVLAYYRFDSRPFKRYSGPFLFDINETFGGLERLDFFSDFGNRNETIQALTLKVDIFPPEIRNIKPEGTIERVNVNISALIDDKYQGNSGINVSSIKMEVDGNTVDDFDVEIINPIKVKIHKNMDLENGEHDVEITVKDNAGLFGMKTWNFTIDVRDPSVIIHMPINGSIFDSRRVLMNISSNEIADIFYNDNGGRLRRLCRNCNNVEKSITFKEGEHEVEVFANGDSDTVHFFIDSIAPRIYRTLPKDGSYATEPEFMVQYKEEFLEKVVLEYGRNVSDNVVELASCMSGRRETCSINIDLRSFDGGEVFYRFIVSDKLRDVESDIQKLIVDVSEPNIQINSPFEGNFSRRVLFDIEIDENVRTLEFMDVANNRPRFSGLCHNCELYNRTKSFSRGMHELVFKATDRAGNVGFNNVSFVVV
ncbi:MAG: lamin tail domain-containing protein [Nanoarchaeota archaeon]